MNELQAILSNVRFELLVARKTEYSEEIFKQNESIFSEEPIFKNKEEDEKNKDLANRDMARVAGMFIFE